MTPGIYELILRAPDGRERRTLAWFPNERCKQDYYEKARKRGLEIEIINNERELKTELQ